MPFAIDGLRSHFTMLLFVYEEMRYLLVSGAEKDTLGQLYSSSLSLKTSISQQISR